MAGIELTISNLIYVISALSPLLIGFFMIMLTIVNQNIKGIIYLAGVLITTILNIFLMNAFQDKIPDDAPLTCNIIELPFISQFQTPSPTSLFLAFTFIYLLLPMINHSTINYAVIATLCGLIAIDSVARVSNKCTSPLGVVLGIVVGLLGGAGWYYMFHGLGYDELLYYDEMQSNAVVCSKPKKQTFKCAVYKNGQLVTNGAA